MDTALPYTVQGMSPDEWQQLVAACQTYLVGIATKRSTTTYRDVMASLGIDRFKIAHVLGEVTRQEKEAGRPSLSALVLYADKAEPGPGFAQWSKQNGWLSKDASDEESYVYWLKEVHNCWVRWG